MGKGKDNRDGVLFFSPPYAFLGGEELLDPQNRPPLVSLGAASVFSYVSAKAKVPCHFYYSTDYSEGAIKRVLRQYQPRIVAISGFSFNRFACLAIARIAKRTDPSVVVVWGGVHATFLDEQLLTHYPYVDLIVRGEGEATSLELVDAIYQGKEADGIAGVSLRFKGKVIRTPSRPRVKNLDEFPLIDYSKVMLKGDFLKASSQPFRTALPVEFSRGCPFTCSFCSTVGFWERQMTYRSVERVIEQIKLMPSFPGQGIFFSDTNMTVNPDHFESLCRALIKHKVNIPWFCETRIDLVDVKALRLMKMAGCELVFFGVESFSKKILLGAGKKFEPYDAVEKINLAVSLGFKVRVSLIIGLPGETHETLAETMRHCQGINSRANIFTNIAMLYPGSRLYQMALKQGFDESYWLKHHKDLCPFYEGALPVHVLRKWEKAFNAYLHTRHKKG
jgi:radical SAM superfamily enzyme YgiQ (UPF0313 family)